MKTMMAAALALTLGSAHAQTQWVVKPDDMLGLWAWTPGNVPHQVETVVERPRDGQRDIITCAATHPHGFHVIAQRGLTLIAKTARDTNESYLTAGDIHLYREQPGKLLYGIQAGDVYKYVDGPMRPMRRTTQVRCLDRIDRTAKPERTQAPEGWRISATEPLIGYWWGTLTHVMGRMWGERLRAAFMVSEIDAEGRVKGAACIHYDWETRPFIDTRIGAKRQPDADFDLWARPFGTDVPGGSPAGEIRDEGRDIGENATRARRSLWVESMTQDHRYRTQPTTLRTWRLAINDEDIDRAWMYILGGKKRAYREVWSGEMHRTQGPDGCLKVIAPMLPPMMSREDARATEDPERARRRSNGRWKDLTR